MIIGLTGGIGSGKSTIAKQLRQMGYAVYDTDSEAKRLIVEDAAVRKQMIQLFGSDVYKDGIYQTAFVAQRVFTDKSLLAQLNAIVHPAVRADILRTLPAPPFKEGSSSPLKGRLGGVIFVECAILYQAGFDTLCDKVVAVTAPEEIRLARVLARDHSTIDKVRARMRAQEAERDIERADIVLNNDGKASIPTLCEEIIHLLSK